MKRVQWSQVASRSLWGRIWCRADVGRLATASEGWVNANRTTFLRVRTSWEQVGESAGDNMSETTKLSNTALNIAPHPPPWDYIHIPDHIF